MFWYRNAENLNPGVLENADKDFVDGFNAYVDNTEVPWTSYVMTETQPRMWSSFKEGWLAARKEHSKSYFLPSRKNAPWNSAQPEALKPAVKPVQPPFVQPETIPPAAHAAPNTQQPSWKSPKDGLKDGYYAYMRNPKERPAVLTGNEEYRKAFEKGWNAAAKDAAPQAPTPGPRWRVHSEEEFIDNIADSADRWDFSRGVLSTPSKSYGQDPWRNQKNR